MVEVTVADGNAGTETVTTEVAQAHVESVQAKAAAAVAIAETDAAASVQRAEIAATTEQAAIAAATELATAVSREEMEQCQSSIANLSTQLSAMEATALLILTRLEKLEPLPPNLPEGDGSGQTLDNQEAPAEPEKKKSKVRWT